VGEAVGFSVTTIAVTVAVSVTFVATPATTTSNSTGSTAALSAVLLSTVPLRVMVAAIVAARRPLLVSSICDRWMLSMSSFVIVPLAAEMKASSTLSFVVLMSSSLISFKVPSIS
jgi:hypothetical protein